MKSVLKSLVLLSVLCTSGASYGTQIGPNGNAETDNDFTICHTRLPYSWAPGNYVVSTHWMAVYVTKCDDNDNGTISIGSIDDPPKYFIQGDCSAVINHLLSTDGDCRVIETDGIMVTKVN